MGKCWLQYYDGENTFRRRFNPIDKRNRPETDRETVRSLRGIDTAFTLSNRRQITLTISADELEGGRGFIEAFWGEGVQWWYNPDGTFEVPETGWIEVTIPGGLIPFEYIDDIEELPEITLTLTERFPR